MRISLRQVAERAGVSDATVSRVLNNANVRIADDTRMRIQAIAAEMGYYPNRLARALVTGRTQTLAVWTSNLSSAYYTQLINYTREEIIKHDYELMISSAALFENAVFDAGKISSWPVDGVLTFDLPRGTLPGLANSHLMGKPFLAVGGYVPENTDSVRVEFVEQVIEAVLHLEQMGCRRIAYLVPNWFEWFREVDDARLRGYDTAMDYLERPPEYIVSPAELRHISGPAVTNYVEQFGAPDGIFCFNDYMAIGAYRALRDMGYRIPDDVALVGCDGIEDMEYFDPPISTIAQPVIQMCSTAWSLLSGRIAEPELPLQNVVLQSRLEIRGSSARTGVRSPLR